MSDLRKKSLEEILAYCRNADGEGGASTPSDEGAASAPEPASEPVAETPAPAAKKPAAPVDPGKMSVADMLAAARGEKTGAAAPAESEAGGEESSAEEAAPAAPAKDPAKMSVAEMMAAARGEKVKPAAAKKSAPKPKPKAAAAGKAKKEAAAETPKREGPKDTMSILAAARGAKPGPISKSEAASRKKEAAAPKKGKQPIVVPPMPAKPEYAQATPAARASDDEETTRRGFFGATVGFVGGALFGSSMSIAFTALGATSLLWVLGLARYMFPNVLTEPPTRFKVGFPDTLSPGQVEAKYKAQFGVWIVRAEFEGQQIVYALKSVCTHLGCTPNWLEGEQKFKCPCHGSGFYKTGVNFEGPAPRPLERYAIKVADDGQLEVDKSQVFLEDKGQWTDGASFVPV